MRRDGRVTGPSHIVPSPILARSRVSRRQQSELPPHDPEDEGNVRLARLQDQVRARTRESLAACLSGRRSPAETEDFLVWMAEAYWRQRQWIGP